MERGEVQSKPRNPVLANLLRDVLAIWNVESGPGIASERAFLDVLNDADDLHERFRLPIPIDLLSDRVFAGKIFVRQGAIYDRNKRL